jgi:hypothetical protein
MAHIHTHHLGRAVLQQAIGEATGALTHIQAAQAIDLDACGLQSAFELQAATRHITRLGIVQQLQGSAFGHLVAVLDDGAPSPVGLLPLHAPSNQSLGLRARSG